MLFNIISILAEHVNKEKQNDSGFINTDHEKLCAKKFLHYKQILKEGVASKRLQLIT